jgi:hypothetical protein
MFGVIGAALGFGLFFSKRNQFMQSLEDEKSSGWIGRCTRAWPARFGIDLAGWRVSYRINLNRCLEVTRSMVEQTLLSPVLHKRKNYFNTASAHQRQEEGWREEWNEF